MHAESSAHVHSGQDVYVGIDTHKKSWKVAIGTRDGQMRTISQDPRPEVLLKYLRRNFAGGTYHLVYEAGFAGNWIARAFARESVDCSIISPADVPTTDKQRRHKTDTRDCRHLAETLMNRSLERLYVPSVQQEDDRQLVRTRAMLVRKQTRVKNQIKSQLAFVGTELPPSAEISHWSARFIEWIEGLFIDRPSMQQAIGVYLVELKGLRRQILDVTRLLRQMSVSELYAERVALLVSVPGISVVGAMIFLSEVIDINRFDNCDKLASYAGLIPASESSGEVERSTGVTPRGNKMLRVLLVEAAWVAIRHDPELCTIFQEHCRRMPKNKAIIAIARRLLTRMQHVLRHKERYRINNRAQTAGRSLEGVTGTD